MVIYTNVCMTFSYVTSSIMDKILKFYTCNVCQGRHSSLAHRNYFNIELMSKHRTIYTYSLEVYW